MQLARKSPRDQLPSATVEYSHNKQEDSSEKIPSSPKKLTEIKFSDRSKQAEYTTLGQTDSKVKPMSQAAIHRTASKVAMVN